MRVENVEKLTGAVKTLAQGSIKDVVRLIELRGYGGNEV